MKEQAIDFERTPAREALAHASQALNDAYKKNILFITPSTAELAFIKRAFNQSIWIIDQAQSIEDAIRHFASEPNNITIVDIGICNQSQNGIRPNDFIEQLYEINPNALIITLSSEDFFLRPEVRKGIWEMVIGANTAETLTALQDAAHNAWKTRLNRAEMELAQRAKVVELINYETTTYREYGLHQVYHDLMEDITEIKEVSSRLKKESTGNPSLEQLIERINEGMVKIGFTIDKVRNIYIESNNKTNPIKL